MSVLGVGLVRGLKNILIFPGSVSVGVVGVGRVGGFKKYFYFPRVGFVGRLLVLGGGFVRG